MELSRKYAKIFETTFWLGSRNNSDSNLETLSNILPKGKYKSNISTNLFKTKALKTLIGARTIEELYVSYTSHWMIDELLLINSPINLEWYVPTKANYHSCLKQITAMDIDRYLVGDILNKVDMASMANSLETRAPFLDVRLAEFGYHLSDKEDKGMRVSSY